jgi:hypothetical protein
MDLKLDVGVREILVPERLKRLVAAASQVT